MLLPSYKLPYMGVPDFCYFCLFQSSSLYEQFSKGLLICKDVSKVKGIQQRIMKHSGWRGKTGNLLLLQGLMGQRKELLLESGKICGCRRPHLWVSVEGHSSYRCRSTAHQSAIPRPLYPPVWQSPGAASHWPVISQVQWENPEACDVICKSHPPGVTEQGGDWITSSTWRTSSTLLFPQRNFKSTWCVRSRNKEEKHEGLERVL